MVNQSKKLTLDVIARHAGTSKSTVSRVLSNDPRISESTRKKVNRVIERHHYRPNLFARALAGGKTGLIGVISSNIGSGFYAEVIRGIDIVFSKLNKRLLVSFAHFEHDYNALWKDMVLGGQLEGLIVLAPTSDFFNLELDTRRIPLVICVGRANRRQTQWNEVPRINMDNKGAVNDIVEHLARQGCRKLLHAAGWTNNTDAVERKKAFRSACRRHNVQGEIEPFGIVQEDGKESMRKFLSGKRDLPDAVVCFNDSIALGVLEAWHELHGQDSHPPFAITGWDDSPAAGVIGLTSVSIPCLELGEKTALLLDKQLQGLAEPGTETFIDIHVAYRHSTDFFRKAKT